MTNDQLEQYRRDTTRTISLPDGTPWPVRMTPQLWDDFEFLEVVEGITAGELARFAVEEMELQQIDFDEAFRCVVAHLANRWT